MPRHRTPVSQTGHNPSHYHKNHSRGGHRDDHLIGTDGRDILKGGPGDDLIDAKDGSDWLWGNAGGDELNGGGGNDTVFGGTGDDIIDGGAGSDRVAADSGDDTVIYNVSENQGSFDVADGGRGEDTLLLEMTGDEWLSQQVQADIAAYLDFLDEGACPPGFAFGRGPEKTFAFSSFGLKASGFENLRIIVDGVEQDPADEPVTAGDDEFAISEDGPALSASVLDNDSVPDLVSAVELVSDVDAGNLILNADGTFSFDPAGAFDYLKQDETAEVSFAYRVTDADGDNDLATATIIISGETDVLAGNAADGYFAAATVIGDANNNGVHDDGEAIAMTDGSGDFELVDPAGTLVMTGGIDVATGLAFEGMLKAPEGSGIITPLTTLVQALADGGMDVTAAHAAVLDGLGLAPAIDLLSLDAIAATLLEDAEAAAVQAASTQVLNSVTVIANLLVGAGAASYLAASNAAFAAVATSLPADLADETTLGGLAGSAAASLGIDISSATSTVAAAAALLAETNQAVADALSGFSDGEDFLTGITQVAIVAQGEAADAVELAAQEETVAGQPGSAVDALSEFTGTSLDAKIDEAAGSVGDLDGAKNNTAPTASPGHIYTQADIPHVFSLADFGFHDVDFEDAMTAIGIVSLPASGTLTLSGIAVGTGAAIGTGDIASGNLVLTPDNAAGGTVDDAFGFTVSDGVADSVIATMNVTSIFDAPELANDVADVTENATVLIDVLGNDSGTGLKVVSATSLLGSPVTFTGNTGDGVGFTADGAISLVFTPRFGASWPASWDHLPEGAIHYDVVSYSVEDAAGQVVQGATFAQYSYDFGTFATGQPTEVALGGVTITSPGQIAIAGSSVGVVGGAGSHGEYFIDAGESLNFEFDDPAINIRFGADSFWDEAVVLIEGFDKDGVSLGVKVFDSTTLDNSGFDINLSHLFDGAPLSRMEYSQVSGTTRLKGLDFDAVQGEGYAVVQVTGTDDIGIPPDRQATVDEDDRTTLFGQNPNDYDVDGPQLDSFIIVSQPELGSASEGRNGLTYSLWNAEGTHSSFDFLSVGDTYDVTFTYTYQPQGGDPWPTFGTVTVTVLGENDAPDPLNAEIYGIGGGIVTGNLLATATDTDQNDQLSIAPLGKGRDFGTPFTWNSTTNDPVQVTIWEDGSIAVDLSAAGSGIINLSFQITDGIDTAFSTVLVQWGDDAAGVTPPVSQTVSGATNDDTLNFVAGTQAPEHAVIENPVTGEVLGASFFTVSGAAYSGGDGTDTLVLPGGSNLLMIEDSADAQLLDSIELIRSSAKGTQFLQLASDTVVLGDLDIDLGTSKAVIWSNAGNDTITTGDKDDRIDGGAGNDTINAGGGTNLVTGGDGVDTFIFDDVFGETTITDFVAGAGGSEVLDLSAFGFSSADEVTSLATNYNQGVSLQLDSDTSILLLGVTASDLVTDDFLV